MIANGINLGRKRGEFEQATRTLRSVQNGHRDPIAAGILPMERAAELCARAAAFYNGQRKEGRLLNGVPDEKWARATTAQPLRALDPERMHVFLPETRELKIRGGHVFVRHNGRTLAWCEPELFAHLGEGYRIAIRFDPTEPTLGAAVFNLETGSRNQWAFTAGQFLGVAEHAPEAPQITAARGFLTEEEERDMDRRRRHRETVRAEYRAIGVFGRKAAAASEVRGVGGTARVERGVEAALDGLAAGRSATAPAARAKTRRPEIDADKLAAEVEALERRMRGDAVLMNR